MKKLTIAFLYNVYLVAPDPSKPETFKDADYDSMETINAIHRHLKSLGHKVIPIEANEDVYQTLRKHANKIDIALNYAEGKNGRDRECHIPSILEMLKIPYVGCRPLTQAIIFNKARTKEVLKANKIPTAKYQVFKTGTEPKSRHLKFPLIVKPIAQGQSAGITKKSVVKNEKELYEQVLLIIGTFGEEALVEEFLLGREFSIAMLGNPPVMFPIVEINHKNKKNCLPEIASIEVKFSEDVIENYLQCPALISSKLAKKLERICHKTWNALGIDDWCRIDIRTDENENPFVLEINSPASIEPPETVSGYCTFPLAAQHHGLSYPDFLNTLITSSLKRHDTKI